MDSVDKEVGDLLESFRLSHKSLIDTEKGGKRPAEEEPEQEGNKENNEGKEHGKEREDKEEADVEDERRSSKRQKRTNIEAGVWQSFEEELDLAGATPSAAPVTFEFADTVLPLRFKAELCHSC